jgi:hypothetical protein
MFDSTDPACARIRGLALAAGCSVTGPGTDIHVDR